MNKTELKTKIGSVLVENDEGLITAADVSGLLTDVLDCTEIGGNEATINAISGTVTDLTVDALSAENSAEILINNNISLKGDIYDVNSLIMSPLGDGIINNVSEIRGAYTGTGITGDIDIDTNINIYGEIKGESIEGSTINFLAGGTGTINLLSVRNSDKVTLMKENIISIYKTGSYTGELTIRTDKLMPFNIGTIIDNFKIGDSTHCAEIYSKSITVKSGSVFSYIHPNYISLNSRINLEAYSGDGIIRNTNNSAKIILAQYSTGSNIITGFDSITLGTGSTTTTLNKNGIISGATGKYIDLANGTISGVQEIRSNEDSSVSFEDGINRDESWVIISPSNHYHYFLYGNGKLAGEDSDKYIDFQNGILSGFNVLTGIHHIKGVSLTDMNSTGVIVDNDLHFNDDHYNHIIINDTSIKMWDASFRQINPCIDFNEQGGIKFVNSITIGSTSLDERTLMALKNLLNS